MVIIAIISLLLALFMPAVQKVRGTMARTACLNNLRQCGLAVHSFHTTHGHLPPLPRGGTNFPGSPYVHQQVSWQVYALPYVERDELWRLAGDAYANNPDPLSTPHEPVRSAVVRTYGCPADSRVLVNHISDGYLASYTSYLAVTGSGAPSTIDGCFPGRPGIRLTDVRDGTSQTIMVGERPPSASLDAGWWYATHLRTPSFWEFEMTAESGVDPYQSSCGGFSTPGFDGSFGYYFAPGRLDDNCDKYHFWSLHTGGANFLFADGSARFLPYSARPILRNLATRAGSEVVTVPD
jgi:prepilin-type processing-associated H-X9-DG protein